MRVGILGGTFDPIHMGHMIAAECVRDQLGLDEVWFMPSHIPPHKDHQPEANPAERLEMIEAAIDHHAVFRALDIELHREGASYTYDTVLELKERYPQHTFYFIIGGDMVRTLHQWDRIDLLLKQICFVGCHRAGMVIDWADIPDEVHDNVQMVEMPLIEMSSTDIRSRRKNKQTIRFFVHDHVHAYIEENRLYES